MRDWFGVRTPSAHGSLPPQCAEAHSGAMALGLVSVSQDDGTHFAGSILPIASEAHACSSLVIWADLKSQHVDGLGTTLPGDIQALLLLNRNA